MNDMSRPMPEQPQPMPVQPDTPLTATLAAQEWNVVMGALNELPRRVSDPVFNKLLAQLNDR